MFSSLVFAQGINEPLPGGQAEIGYSHYWHEGDFYWDPISPAQMDIWSNGTIYFKFGLYDIVTLSVEGMVLPVTSKSNYPGQSYLNYTFGIALSSPTIDFFVFDLYLNIHYLDNLYLDRSDQKNDKRFRNVQVDLPIRYRLMKHYTVWIGPLYNWNETNYFKDQTYFRSNNSPGITFGVDALLFKHIYLNITVRYIDSFLPNMVAGFRF